MLPFCGRGFPNILKLVFGAKWVQATAGEMSCSPLYCRINFNCTFKPVKNEVVILLFTVETSDVSIPVSPISWPKKLWSRCRVNRLNHNLFQHSIYACFERHRSWFISVRFKWRSCDCDLFLPAAAKGKRLHLHRYWDLCLFIYFQYLSLLTYHFYSL